jgi:hypothetical protein
MSRHVIGMKNAPLTYLCDIFFAYHNIKILNRRVIKM